jgi:hypothetical protein
VLGVLFGAATPQPSGVLVRVVDAATGRALPNAQVTTVQDGRAGEPRLTDDAGRVRLRAAAGDSVRVRVRQIGYVPTERLVAASGPETEVRLDRVPLVLPAQRATTASECTAFADASDRETAAALYGRLREAAEQYEAFRRAYPFEAHVESRLANPRTDGGRRPIVRVSAERYASDRWEADYRPGDVVHPDGPSFRADILFVSTLANDRFWAHHCFAVGGVVPVGGRPAVRVTFAPTARTRGPDWAGAALLDSATHQLLRVEFRLERPVRYGPRRLEGYTTFMTPSPFVAVPESTLAVWWEREPGPAAAWGTPDAVHLVHVQRLAYRRAHPPATQPTVPR